MHCSDFKRLLPFIYGIIVFVFTSNTSVAGNPTYKLKYGEDLRSVALKFGISEVSLIELNQAFPTRYALVDNSPQEILKLTGTPIKLPEGARQLKNWDKESELDIFLENMLLLFSYQNTAIDVIENYKIYAKRYYDPFLKRMTKDFGFRLYKPYNGETLSVIALRYDNALLEFERLNPVINIYMSRSFPKNIKNWIHPVELFGNLKQLPICMPSNLKPIDDRETSYKLWSLNLSSQFVTLTGNPKDAINTYYNMHGGSYRRSCLWARYRHACYLIYENSSGAIKI